MINHNASKGDDAEVQAKSNPKCPILSSARCRIFSAVIISFIMFIALAIVSRFYMDEHSPRLTFFAANALSLSVLLAIIAQAFIYYGQMEAMVRQNENWTISERGYIGLRNLKIMGLREGGKVGVHAIFRNGGRTPAWNLKAGAIVTVGNEPMGFKWKDSMAAFRHAFIPMSEDRKFLFPSEQSFTDEIRTAIHDGTKLLFVDGKARYSTIGRNERVLCFGGTYSNKTGEMEVRYQYERDSSIN